MAGLWLDSEELAYHHPFTHFTRVTFGGKTSIFGPEVVRGNRSSGFVASAPFGQTRSYPLPGQAAVAQGVEISQAKPHGSSQRDPFRVGSEFIDNRADMLANVHVGQF